MKSKKSNLGPNNNLNFSNSNIKFTSINVDEDCIDVYLLCNNEKVKSIDSKMNNYFRIITKDIGVQDNYKELTFRIVNDIEITINIIFKNKFSIQQGSVRDRLNFFNQKVGLKKCETTAIFHKKIKIDNFGHKEETKVDEPQKKEIKDNCIPIENEDKNKEENKNKEEDVKNKDENGNKEENKNNKNNEVNINKEENKNDKNNNEEKSKRVGQKNEMKKEDIPQQKEEITPKKDQNIKQKNYYKHCDLLVDQEQPQKKPGKLKMPEVFLFLKKEPPKKIKKEEKIDKEKKEKS